VICGPPNRASNSAGVIWSALIAFAVGLLGSAGLFESDMTAEERHIEKSNMAANEKFFKYMRFHFQFYNDIIPLSHILIKTHLSYFVAGSSTFHVRLRLKFSFRKGEWPVEQLCLIVCQRIL